MKRLLSIITSPFRVILLFLWCNPETVACERVLFFTEIYKIEIVGKSRINNYGMINRFLLFQAVNYRFSLECHGHIISRAVESEVLQFA